MHGGLEPLNQRLAACCREEMGRRLRGKPAAKGELLDQAARRDPHTIAVIEAAILIETGRYKVFDRLILTACSEAVQIARAMGRDGLSREAVKARMDKQLPLEEKKKYADYVVNTDGTKEETLRQVEAVFRQLEALARVH